MFQSQNTNRFHKAFTLSNLGLASQDRVGYWYLVLWWGIVYEMSFRLYTNRGGLLVSLRPRLAHTQRISYERHTIRINRQYSRLQTTVNIVQCLTSGWQSTAIHLLSGIKAKFHYLSRWNQCRSPLWSNVLFTTGGCWAGSTARMTT